MNKNGGGRPQLDQSDRLIVVFALLGVALVIDPPFAPGPFRVFASIVVGALLSLLVSRYYARQTSNELEEQAAELREHVEEQVDRVGKLMRILAGYLQKEKLISNVKTDNKGGLADWDEHTLIGGAVSYQQSAGGGTIDQGHPSNQEAAQENAERS